MKKEAGYVLDVSYPAHFHKEIQPVWLSSLTHFLGTVAPDISKPYSYCELGCGVGINLLVAAATNPLGQFVGVDFNERHLAVARDAARSIGLDNIRFIQADFARFAQDNNLFFDFIVSHGVWSWIAPNHQQSMLQLVQKFLKPKGLFYLHYMCHPGATQMIPVQKLLNELAHHRAGTAEQNIQAGLELLGRLDGAGAFVDQPRLSASVQGLPGKGTAYLAHDFLTDYWRPQHSVDVHRLAAQAGVTYLGSADTFDNLEGLSIPGNLQPVLASITSPAVRETVKDLARNQHQRRDLFQRAPERLSAQQHLQQVDAIRFRLLPEAPRSGAVHFATPIGAIQGPEEIFSPLLQALAARPASFAGLRQLPAFANSVGLLSQSLQMLMWRGYAHPLRQGQLTNPEPVGRLKEWIVQQQLNLQVVEDCGTATYQLPDKM
ncbi:class I SAM-dependent methyltransferase [Pseudomonas sp. MYb185]|uniref:class I SAM-dependent methyltransferase n=1 Tax=Pseudomonas sp. MYb185 TaxID=1848729 RepID=UPI000CFD68D4|nr:class I SAM-dependent methyltransferase [Pseudomonas sp. MYb185]PRB78992.1 SAM-dependent methyltransferase [Pseudomonas sp. MYb185]